jgi:peptidoglycan/LPS O-acetylase OafA/YrhL
MKKEQIYLPGLNGIRMIAALTVVISHTLLGINQFGIKQNQGLTFAGYGVTMFFTLSGFLITYLLVKEKKAFNTISIKSFYIRRILRIWPLYYLYLVIAIIGVAFFHFEGKLDNTIWYYIFLMPNVPFVLTLSIPLIAHYWSLGVEEQFYLFWPWLIKKFAPINAVLLFLIIFTTVKFLLRIGASGSFLYIFICVTRFDCMAIGALFAILLDKGKVRFLKIAFNKLTQLCGILIILLAAANKLILPDFINQFVFSIASAILIINVSFNKKSLVNLEYKICNFIGRISYGIYVYHPFMIYLLVLALKRANLSGNDYFDTLIIISLVILLTIFVSWLSYEFFEKKFLVLKTKFAQILSRP